MDSTTIDCRQNVNTREQLVNDGQTGRVTEVSLSQDVISRIRGILLDIDCNLFKKSALVPAPTISPDEFYERHVSHWLDNHPVLAKAEVRGSGNGLHVLLMLDKPIELRDTMDRDRWAARVEIIQAVLPIDPDQPGITAMTRPVGSINGKNGAEVRLLRHRQPIDEVELIDLTDQMIQRPFSTVLEILTGRTSYACPICARPGNTLTGIGETGHCYNTCGNGISLSKLYASLLMPRDAKEKCNA